MVPGTPRRFALLLLSQGVAAAGQFTAAVVVARTLGPADFGVWSYAVAYTSIFASIVDFGMSFVIVRDLARPTRDGARYIGNVIAIKGLLSLCALLLSASLLPLLGGDAERWPVLLLLSTQAVLVSFTTLIAAAAYARGHLLASGAVRSLQGLLLVGAAGGVALLGAGLLAFASAYAAVGLAGILVALTIASWRVGRIVPRFEALFWRSYLRELLPIALAVMLTTVYYSADVLMLGMAGHEREVGWYSAGYRLIYGLLLVLVALNQAFLPDVARSLDAAGVHAPAPVIRYYRAVWTFALPVVLLGPLAAPAVMTTVYGAEYGGGASALQILLVAGGLAFLSSYFGSLLLVAGRQREYLLGVGLAAASNIALNAALIPLFSLHGAAISTVLSEGLVMVWMRASSARILPAEARGVPVVPVLFGLSAAAMAGCAILLGFPRLPAVGGACALYAAAVYVCGAFNVEGKRTAVPDDAVTKQAA